MSNVKIRHSIRRGSSGAISRSIELRDADTKSDSDEESMDDRGSVASSVQGSSSSNVPASTIANHVIEKLVIENNIFLKAALQLLDQRDHSIELNSKTSNNHQDGSSADVIMCGRLKKASSGAVSRIWKDKLVELRHGVLSYEDITGWGVRANKKTIQLIFGQVACRPSQKYHGHVFEIRDKDSNGNVLHHHSNKKLFMADSNDEMARWIEAIRTAMIGSAGDFGICKSGSGDGMEDSHTVRSDELDHMLQHQRSGGVGGLEDWRPLHTAQMGSGDGSDGKIPSSLPKLFTSARKVKKGNHSSSFSSEGVDGFSSEMKRFEHIKRIIHAASTPQEYRECLLDQSLDNIITIPVAYLKKFLRESSLGNFSMRTTGSISNQELLKKEKQRAKLEKKAKKKQGQKIRRSVFGNSSEDKNNHNLHWNLPSRASSIENSQAWKDLFRDSININGDIVNGGVDGPEAMIGALVRHILLQVHHMREKWVSYQDIGVGGGSNVFSSASTSGASTQSEQEARFERARMMASTYADLDEGQALSIARDILLSCNRTESGGDTYYCTQSLLCNSNFAVLTPHGCDVDPIEIVVDVVESSRRRTAIRPCSSSSVCSVNSTTDSPASKEFPSNLYHHLSGINEGTGSATTSPRNNSSDNDGEEGFGALRDSTTVESDNSTEPTENSVSQPQQSHYPESLLNAAAATVKRGGRRVGDIEDYYDPAAQLMLQSDIPGAAAIPSSMLLMKEVSKRKKRLNQPGYIERSDSDTSIGESTSGDSKSNGSEKDSELDGNPSFVTPTIHTTSHHTPVYQINCDDDVTIAVSELTMDTVPQPKTRRNGSMTSTLRKNLGFSTASAAASTGTNTTDDEVSSPAVTKKRHSFFSSWANSKTVEQTPEGHGNTPSRGIFSSPQPHSHPENKSAHSSWRSSKTDDDDASSVTDNRNSRRTHHQHQDVECEEETAAQAMCIRIQVIVKSRYRLCNLDPQDEDEDTWANITGQFHQHFFLKSNSNGRPAVSDRFVTVKVDDPSVGY